MSEQHNKDASDAAPLTRRTKDGPWCWQSKAIRERIRLAFDATNNVCTALGVYDALTEIASDQQAEVFKTTHAKIREKSGVSVSTIKKHLSTFNDLGLVSVSTPKLREASTYTLRRMANGCLTIANGQSVPLAALEEGKKKNAEKTMSALVAATTSQTVLVPSDSTLSELRAEAEANGNQVEFEKWLRLNQRKGWMQANKATGTIESIKHLRESLTAFIQHISVENQCGKDGNSRRNPTPMTTDYSKGF